MQAAAQPGSIDSEAGIFAMAFDLSNTRLITAEADKTIKIYKEDESAVNFHSYSYKLRMVRGSDFITVDKKLFQQTVSIFFLFL